MGWLVCCLMGVALVASAQSDSPDTFGGDPTKNSFLWIPADTDDWTRHFHIGGIVGLNVSANFSMNGKFDINHADGIYDDGYVREDQTGNAGGYTSFWGYNNASQYNAAAGTLDMHRITSFTSTGHGSSQQDGGPFPGFDMAYGDNLWYWKHARVGWELGFSLLPVTIKDSNPMSVSASQMTYTYHVGNSLGVPLPQAPYQGNSSGLGSIIPDTHDPPSTESDLKGTVTGTQELDLEVYTLRLGPSFYWDVNDYLGFSFGAGPAVGLVSGNYKFNQIVSVPATATSAGISTHDSGEFSSTQVTYGGYVNGMLLYHVINDADFYLSAQYMPMGSTTFSDSGREGKLNLGGQVYVSLGINWPF